MGGTVFPPCWLTWGQTMLEVMKLMGTSFKMSCACTAPDQCSCSCSSHHQPMPLLETPGHSWASLGQSLVRLVFLCPEFWCAQSFVCALQESVSPVLCKFWWLYDGINGDLLQEGLCHTQVCCIQNPCLCGRPLLTCSSAGDTQTLKGRSSSVSVGSPGVHKVLFEPSEHFWWVWGLILNTVSPFLPSCWGFPFTLGCEASFSGGIQHFPVDVC